MSKRTTRNSYPSNLVPHPRYGSLPRPSGVGLPENEIRSGYWRYRREHIFPETAIVADTSKQNYAIYPRKYYVDVLRPCRNCSRHFIFFALEQRYWYETLQYYIDADCVLCPTCRKEIQAVRRRLRRYSDLLHKPQQTDKELMFLVEDGAYLLAKGVLRDLDSLGRLKNVAMKRIPQYPGTLALKKDLQNAKVKNA